MPNFASTLKPNTTTPLETMAFLVNLFTERKRLNKPVNANKYSLANLGRWSQQSPGL